MSLLFDTQLDSLLADPQFERILGLVVDEVARVQRGSGCAARSYVLAAISEPVTLARLIDAWRRASQPGESLGLAKLIVRRVVQDRMRREGVGTRPADAGAGASPRELGAEPAEREPADPRLIVQLLADLRAALASGGGTELAPARCSRHAGDPAPSVGRGCPECVLRVRLDQALKAFDRRARRRRLTLAPPLERSGAP